MHTGICVRCNGQKKVQGLGFIEITCPTCKGAGYVSGIPHPMTMQAINDEEKTLKIVAQKGIERDKAKKSKRLS